MRKEVIITTKSGIENLVRQISEARLEDGQFDESGLTLRELRTIEKSMVKSVTSIYHGRVKYPEPKSSENGERKSENGGKKTQKAASKAAVGEKTQNNGSGE